MKDVSLKNNPLNVIVSFNEQMPEQTHIYSKENFIYINLLKSTDYNKELKKALKKINNSKNNNDNIKNDIINNTYILQLNCSKNNNLKIKNFIDTYGKRINYYNFANLKIDDILVILSSNNIPKNARCKYYYDAYSYLNINENEITTKEELEFAMNYLKKIKNLVARYNLSNIEKCILIFDLIREREYKKPLKQNSMNARSLSKVCMNKDIVCLGYANLYAALLNEFDIENELLVLASTNGDKKGHASNNIFIKDDKYNIAGHYVTDITFNNKIACSTRFARRNKISNIQNLNADVKKEYSNAFLSDYEFCLWSYNVLAKYYEKKDFKILASMNCYQDNSIYEWAKKEHSYLQKNQPELFEKMKCQFLLEKLVDNCEQKLSNSTIIELIELYDHFNQYKLQDVKEQLNNVFLNIINKQNNNNWNINAFILALYNVRRVESSMNANKYPLSINNIQTIIKNRYQKEITELEIQELLDNNILKNGNASSIELDAARMRLISALHLITKDGVYNNPTLVKQKK